MWHNFFGDILNMLTTMSCIFSSKFSVRFSNRIVHVLYVENQRNSPLRQMSSVNSGHLITGQEVLLAGKKKDHLEQHKTNSALAGKAKLC